MSHFIVIDVNSPAGPISTEGKYSKEVDAESPREALQSLLWEDVKIDSEEKENIYITKFTISNKGDDSCSWDAIVVGHVDTKAADHELRVRRNLKSAFGELKKKELERLKRHLDNGVEVLVGEKAKFYLDGKGGGCPSSLAYYDEIPKDGVEVEQVEDEDLRELYNFMEAETEDNYLLYWLENATPDMVKEVVQELIQERTA